MNRLILALASVLVLLHGGLGRGDETTFRAAGASASSSSMIDESRFERMSKRRCTDP